MLVKRWSTNLVALATAINVDGLELGLGGDGHGGLDLDAESFRLVSLFLSDFCTYSPDITISGALTQILGILTN